MVSDLETGSALCLYNSVLDADIYHRHGKNTEGLVLRQERAEAIGREFAQMALDTRFRGLSFTFGEQASLILEYLERMLAEFGGSLIPKFNIGDEAMYLLKKGDVIVTFDTGKLMHTMYIPRRFSLDRIEPYIKTAWVVEVYWPQEDNAPRECDG